MVASPPPKPTSSPSLLDTLDAAPTQRFHWRTTLIAGMGFLTDAYDLFVISLAIPILGALYGSGGSLPAYEAGLLGAAALIGAAVGPIVFGTIADRIGRRTMYAVTLSVMAVGSIGSALSAPGVGLSTVSVLILWRLLLGLGVGGEYPLSATIMSEYANVRSRGRLVAMVFAMQGFGLLLGAAVSVSVVYLVPTLDVAWRLILGFGAVPALVTIYFRTRLPETPRFSLSRGAASEAARTVRSLTGRTVSSSPRANPPVLGRLPARMLLRTYGPLIFATALSWFLLDMAFYSTSIFNPLILREIGFAGVRNLAPLGQVRLLALGNLLIALAAAIPGYWASVALIDRVGRRPLQAIGFGVMAAAFLLLSVAYAPLVSALPAFVFLYSLTFFFGNFGPNTTTFVYPSEVFPTPFRTTGHGLAAAAGKAGAVVAVFLFPPLVAADGLSAFLGILAGTSLAGLAVTLSLLPETTQRSLEDASGEDELDVLVHRFSTYLRSLSLTVAQGAEALRRLLDDPQTDRETKLARIRTIEHAADEEVHRIFVELNNRRLSADVRTDVGHLASAIDDIMDGIESVSARVMTYHLRERRPELVRFADLVVDCVREVDGGILALDELYRGSTGRLEATIVEVNRLENEADDLLRSLLEELFRDDGAEPLRVLKWKDFYERLEVITDRCEDVTDVFQDLAVRYAPESG